MDDIAECDTLLDALKQMNPPEQMEALAELIVDGLFQQDPIERVDIGLPVRC